MKLPKITSKQAEILELLYRYRFLNRIQIQSFLGHTDKRRVMSWLKDLREKNYLEWIYSTDFIEKTKPAIYYIGINGLRHLKTLEWDDDSTIYQPEELHKRYREGKRSRIFIDRSILLTDCCISLEQLHRNDGLTSKIKYTYITEADCLNPDSDYYFLSEHEKLRPNLCIVKKKGRITTNYLLEIFDPTLPQYRVRSKVKNYVKYLTDYEWEGDDPRPIILLVLPSLYGLIYAKRKIRKLLLDEYYEAADIPKDLHIRFTTTEHLQRAGITGSIWEEGRKRFGV